MAIVEKISNEILPRRFGRYLLFKHLGEGAMGRVYMASLGGRVCAVKTLLGENEDPHIVQRFLDEAQLVTRLSHPNLVYVSEIGEAEGWPFVAMEYVRGKTVFEVWRRAAERGKTIPIGITLLVAREVLNGLAYMHEKTGLDLIHRDLAPNNVMVGAMKTSLRKLATSGAWLARSSRHAG